MDPRMVQQDMRDTNRVFESEVAANRNIAALDRVYTANARILPPGSEMISGRENIKRFWQGAMDSLGVNAVALETVDVEELGDSAIEIGRAELKSSNESLAPMQVKYVVVWKREDGVWKWHIDIWNASA